MVKWNRYIVTLSLFVVYGCKPDLDETISIVTTPRVLAVRSETMPSVPAGQPEAEGKPSEALTLTALYVDQSGVVTPSVLEWAFCDERKPLAELGPVSPLCAYLSGSWFTPLGVGSEVVGALPADGCAQFGPDPVQQPQQPPERPVDPDPTGGYYQPVRLLGPGSTGPEVTIAETRIVCPINSPSPDISAAFTQRYHRNTNPVVAALRVKGASVPWSSAEQAGAPPNQVAVGQRVELEVSWPPCPTVDVPNDGVCGPDETGTTCGTCGPAVHVSPADCCLDVDCQHAKGCAGAERYVVLDPSFGSLSDQREAIAVAWYATDGAFDFDRAGRSASDLATTSDNAWQAPASPEHVTLWVVLRDDRGGVGWEQYPIDVR